MKLVRKDRPCRNDVRMTKSTTYLCMDITLQHSVNWSCLPAVSAHMYLFNDRHTGNSTFLWHARLLCQLAPGLCNCNPSTSNCRIPQSVIVPQISHMYCMYTLSPSLPPSLPPSLTLRCSCLRGQLQHPAVPRGGRGGGEPGGSESSDTVRAHTAQKPGTPVQREKGEGGERVREG